MLERIKKDFNATTWMLIPIAIILNGAVGWVVRKFDTPLYLDSIGTVLIAIVAGPWVGAFTGVITNLILGFVSPSYIPYWPVPLGIGIVAGVCANAGMFKQWWKVLLAGVLIAITAATLSTLVAMNIHGGVSVNAAYFLLEEPADKIATAVIAFFIAGLLPVRFRARLPRSENI